MRPVRGDVVGAVRHDAKVERGGEARDPVEVGCRHRRAEVGAPPGGELGRPRQSVLEERSAATVTIRLPIDPLAPEIELDVLLDEEDRNRAVRRDERHQVEALDVHRVDRAAAHELLDPARRFGRGVARDLRGDAVAAARSGTKNLDVDPEPAQLRGAGDVLVVRLRDGADVEFDLTRKPPQKLVLAQPAAAQPRARQVARQEEQAHVACFGNPGRCG